LLVDDDPATLLALTGVLETRFHTLAVDTCESGVVALDKVATCDYDAIVSDIKMPGMDGLELMHQVLKIRPTTPTLLVTGHGDDGLGVKALDGGAYTFIQKPIDRDYFIAWLKRAIHLRQVIRQIEDQNRLPESTVGTCTTNPS
jgi:DNA-binding NtrC family response regulator